MNTDSAFNLLNSTIKWLSKDRKFHICLHDLSGIFHETAFVQLPKKNTIHSCDFCEYAKTTTTGFRFCLKCKELSLKRALEEKRSFTGECYLGLTEIIKPVFYNGKPICVIYLGNLTLKETSARRAKKIKKVCSVTGVKEELLQEALNTTELTEASKLAEYGEIVDILENIILQAITKDIKLQRKSVSTLPSYRTTNHWIIEHIQHYIMTYYNRDLQLSQLAKLYFLNPQYLCRLFKKEIGRNFSDYVNAVRIEKSQQLLALTEYSIVDISIEVGYDNVTYFNRLFKRYTGITPSEYRSNQLHVTAAQE